MGDSLSAGSLADIVEVEMVATVIVIWNHEPVYESPARKTFTVTWSGQLRTANLMVDVDPNFWTLEIGKQYIERIVLNGTDVSFYGDRNDVVIADVRNLLRNGANYIEIYHNGRVFIPGIQTAGMYTTLTIEAESVSGEVVQPPGAGPGAGFEVPSWLWIVLIVVVVLVLVRS